MNEFEDIQRLIRLKRFEQPEEGFTENFLLQFHQRQRAELLKQSSLELLMERMTTWWSNLLVPKWSMATAAFAVCAMSAWMFTRPAEKPGAALTTSSPAASEKPFVSKMDLSELPLARAGGQDQSPRAVPAVQGNTPAQSLPTSGAWEKPKLQNAIPAVEGGLAK